MSHVVQKPAANTDNPTASFLLFQNTEMFPLQPFRHVCRVIEGYSFWFRAL